MTLDNPAVHYDRTTPALVINGLTVTHPAVCTEALRWHTGSRAGAVGADQLNGCDLSGFAVQALVIGAQAISVAGGTQDTFNLEQLVQDVGLRAAESTTQATLATSRAVAEAARVMRESSDETRKLVSECAERAGTSFATSVASAELHLKEEMTALLGGDDPALLLRLKPLLGEFSADLVARAAQHSTEVVHQATKALDPDEPTSPLARHRAHLDRQHAALVEQVDQQHRSLAAKVDELSTAVKVQKAAAAATTVTTNVTPLKGAGYEDQIHALMRELATGLGDEYVETGTLVGEVSGSKKGDGVLSVLGGQARLVLEMTDSPRRGWDDYLDECERNRRAGAALGLVRTAAQNAGQTIRVLGPRRLVLAFDPAHDDVGLFRSAVLLTRTMAAASVARQDDSGLTFANERIGEALEVLSKVDTIRRAAGSIRTSAGKIDTEGEAMQTMLNRLLLQARSALEGVTSPEAGGAGTYHGAGDAA